MAKIITCILILSLAASAFAAPAYRVRKTDDYHFRQVSQTPGDNRAIERLVDRLERLEKRVDRLEDALDRDARPAKNRGNEGKSTLGISISSDGIKFNANDGDDKAAKEWLCSLDTMGGTFRGVGPTKAVAKNKALKECEKKHGKSIFCDGEEVVCEQ